METAVNSPVKEAQFLTFHIKDQVFGLDILHIKEIMEYTAVTRVPLVPAFILGILNLRGNVVPVIDVASRFGWPKTDITRMTCIVVTEIEYEGSQLDIGLVVDAVNEVVKLSMDNIEQPPNFGTNIRADFVHHVGKTPGGFVLLLSIARLLDVDEIQKLRSLAKERGDANADAPTKSELTLV
ncbi:MAG: chemotaxis protein CheW [Spirochaetes bacterium]|nr:chemotaxis protein CheW [Spirochaetota bacterium]